MHLFLKKPYLSKLIIASVVILSLLSSFSVAAENKFDTQNRYLYVL